MDALCLLRDSTPPDLIILDLNMPGIDGYDVLGKLGPTSPPVVIITGVNLEADSIDMSKVKRVLTKPFNLTDLMNAVEDAIGVKPQVSPPTSTPAEKAITPGNEASNTQD